MIADRVENAHIYYRLGRRFEGALRFIAAGGFKDYEVGTYPVDGDDLFFKIQIYDTLPPEQCKIELHRVYADLHYILEGAERFGYIHKSRCTPSVPYDPAIEMELVACKDMGYVIQRPGCFAIAFPDDAHQSVRMHHRTCRIKKLLMKIRL